MDRKDFAAWCKAATKKIRYGPDREMVSKELRDHLEDRYDALVAKGVSEEEAARQALEAMGSAAAIAPQLGAIHRPWLGWIYSALRVIAVVVALCALLGSVPWCYNYMKTCSKIFGTEEGERLYGVVDRDDEVTFCKELNLRATIDGQNLVVTEVVMMQDDFVYAGNHLLIGMEITSFPWNYGFSAGNYFWAKDSEGNAYPCKQEWTESEPGIWFVNSGTSSLGMGFVVFDIAYFDENAQWVELCYTRDGRNLVFRIDLAGGEES